MSIDAMKQALEALEDVPYMSNKDDYERFEKAQAALRLAIEQAERQEPVEYQYRLRPSWRDASGWHEWKSCSKEVAEDYRKTPYLHDWYYETRALYMQPVTQAVTQIPQQDSSNREWVGLTDEQLEQVFPAIATYNEANKTLYRSIARAIEAKLKEKNT